mgnify:CR=1 FL=1
MIWDQLVKCQDQIIQMFDHHGVEINETAIEIAKKNSLKIFKNSSDIEDN